MSNRLVDPLARLATARRTPEVLSAVRERFGDHVRLFAVDHAFDELVDVERLGAAMTLEGPLRQAVLRSKSVEYEGATWTPLPDRGRSLFVLRHESSLASRPDHPWGQVLDSHLPRFEEVERQRRRQRMDVAAGLQHDLLPIGADLLGVWAVGALLEPAYTVAGDLFDHAYTDERVWAYAFDGMGHGLDATISGVLAVSAVRNARRAGASITEQMGEAARVLFEQFNGDRFVTAIGCCIGGGTVEFVNAGHEPVRRVTGGRVKTLDLAPELPLGVVADHEYVAQRVAVPERGDGFVMFSDGPASARSAAGDEFGAERLDRSTEANWSQGAFGCAHGVLDDLGTFVGDAEITDDITTVVLRRET